MATTSAQRQAELRTRARALLTATDPADFTRASKSHLVEAIAQAARGSDPATAPALVSATTELVKRIFGTAAPVTVTQFPWGMETTPPPGPAAPDAENQKRQSSESEESASPAPDPRLAQLNADLTAATRELAKQDEELRLAKLRHERERKRLEAELTEARARIDRQGEQIGELTLRLDRITRPQLTDPVTVTASKQDYSHGYKAAALAMADHGARGKELIAALVAKFGHAPDSKNLTKRLAAWRRELASQ